MPDLNACLDRLSRPTASGRVIQVREPVQAPPEFSWLRFCLLTLLILAGIAIGIWLAIVALILGLIFGWRFRTGHFWEFLLLRQPRERRHFYQYFFLRCADGHELTAVVSGRRLSGAVEPGHQVDCWGRLRDGILQVSHGWNRTTRSRFGPA